MGRVHTTANGDVPFTPEEEAEADAREAAHAAAEPQRQRDVIQAQIDALERATMLNRGSRELEIVIIENAAPAEAANRGVTVEQLLASIPYYQKLKALDAQIVALRAAWLAVV